MKPTTTKLLFEKKKEIFCWAGVGDGDDGEDGGVRVCFEFEFGR
jgi:hypothetical protein